MISVSKLFTILLGLFILIEPNVYCQELIFTKSGKVSFFSEARLENIEAHSNQGISVININTHEVSFKVSIRSFVFEKGLMQEHFNETYMESDQYPDAQFKGSINENIDFTKDGEYKVTATGKLTMHGITKERVIQGLVTIKEKNINLISEFIVPVSDHDIDIPNNKLTNISQNISVKIAATYVPYVKK